MKPIIAITAGDINGVSYEIILKTIFHPHILEICTPVLYGNVAIAKQHAQLLDEEFRTPQGVIITDARKVQEGKVNVITCYPDDTPLEIGKSTEAAGKASLASLKRACGDLQQGLVHALVTAPINKANIQSDEFRFSGHTEYIADDDGERCVESGTCVQPCADQQGCREHNRGANNQQTDYPEQCAEE